MRKKILAGNWKMNKGIADLGPYFNELNSLVKGGLTVATKQLEIAIAAPYMLLSRAAEVCSGLGISVAAQNVHWELAGAFTGEISPNMLLDSGINWTLIGHSERRQYFAETNLTVEKKVRSALKVGLTVIACVGETLNERKSCETTAVIAGQVAAILSGATGNTSKLIIAYEPVWAIGTGLAATAAEAQEVHKMIRNMVTQQCGLGQATAMRILYGGSMNGANIAELLSKGDIDGGLIGGASLKPKDFADMINLAVN